MVNAKSLLRVLFVAIVLCLSANVGYSASKPTPADPCQSVDATKLSVPISTGSVGQIALVPASSQSIHVCGFAVSPPGGGVFQFAYAPSCSAASLTSLTGLMYMGSYVTPLSYSGPGTIFSVPAGNALCLNTGIPLFGVVTYTQP